MAALGQTNISTTLVGNTLGISTRAVSQLCTSDRINMWSKYKPVRYNANSVDINSDFWKSSNGNCGIDTPNAQSLPSNGPMTQWSYQRPRGSAYNEPFRLGDFRLYNHNAQPLLSGKFQSTMTLNESYAAWVTRNSYADFAVDSMTWIRSRYPALALCNRTKGDLRYVTLGKTVEELPADQPMLVSIDIPNTWSGGDVVEAYLALANTMQNTVSTYAPSNALTSLNLGPDIFTGYYKTEIAKQHVDSYNVNDEYVKDAFRQKIKWTITSNSSTFTKNLFKAVMTSNNFETPSYTITVGCTESGSISAGQSFSFESGNLRPYLVNPNSDGSATVKWDLIYSFGSIPVIHGSTYIPSL